MDRRQFIRIAGGGVIAPAVALPLAGCSSDYPAEAVQAWQGPAADGGDVRRWILSYAILAPHSHNLQSWLVDLRRRRDRAALRPHAAAARDRSVLAPDHDEPGHFLELLDLAARAAACAPTSELFPEGEFGPEKPDTRPVARIRLTADTAVAADPLFAQILRRRTNRRPTRRASRQPRRGRPSPTACRLPDSPGFVGAAQPQALQRHRAIAIDAWRIELVTPRTIMESYKVLRVGPRRLRSTATACPSTRPWFAPRALGLFDRSKAPAPDDAATTGQIKDFDAKIASTPAFFWMVTEGNDRETQVNAGAPMRACNSPPRRRACRCSRCRRPCRNTPSRPSPTRRSMRCWRRRRRATRCRCGHVWATRRRSGRRRAAAWTPT